MCRKFERIHLCEHEFKFVLRSYGQYNGVLKYVRIHLIFMICALVFREINDGC